MSWRARMAGAAVRVAGAAVRVAGAAMPVAIAGVDPIDEWIPKRVWIERP